MITKPVSIFLIYIKTNIIIYDHQTDKTNVLHRTVKQNVLTKMWKI